MVQRGWIVGSGKQCGVFDAGNIDRIATSNGSEGFAATVETGGLLGLAPRRRLVVEGIC